MTDIEELAKLGKVIKEYENDGEVVTLQSAESQIDGEKWEAAKKVKNPFGCLFAAHIADHLPRGIH